jgi:hypothetical protein
MCVCVCARARARAYVCTHVSIQFFIQKKLPMSDNMTPCLYHYVVLNNVPVFNTLKHLCYNTCTTWIKTEQHWILSIQCIYMFHMTILSTANISLHSTFILACIPDCGASVNSSKLMSVPQTGVCTSVKILQKHKTPHVNTNVNRR